MTIKELQDRAVALSDKYQVGSVTPKDIGDLFNDFMTYVYTLQQNLSSLGIRKIYPSYRDMVNDLEPTANGFKLKFGQLVAIASEDEDAGKIYSYAGDQSLEVGGLQWVYVGKVAQLTAILNEFYEMQSTLSTMSKQLSAHTIDLQAIHESLSNQSTAIGSNTTEIGKLRTALNVQSTAVSNNATNISDLQTELGKQSTAVSQNGIEISKLKATSISSVDVSQIDSLIVPPTEANGKADYWVTHTYGSNKLIVGRLFLIEDMMFHKVTQVLMTNNTIEGITTGSHIKEGFNVYYRFYGHTGVDVPMKQWTEWKALYDSEATTPQEIIDYINAKLANKVDYDDNAPELTAGFANNLVGRGEATEEYISFRPSGGSKSIEDGVAKIEKVKGETVVWNQIADAETWINNNYGLTSYSYADGVLILKTTTAGDYKRVGIEAPSSLVSHKVLVTYRVKSNAEFSEMARGVGIRSAAHAVGGRFVPFSANTSWTSHRGFCSVTDVSKNGYIGIVFNVSEEQLSNAGGELILEFKDIEFIDLTQMFGAGNEPTTIEEFNARKPMGVTNDYNEGELVSMNVDAVKSVGFNAWDEEWELGTISANSGVDAASTTRIRSKNYCACVNANYKVNTTLNVSFYDGSKNFITTQYPSAASTITPPSNARYFRLAFPESYGTTYKNDICIHLVHTGYRNGEYEPYEEFTRNLPISEIKDKEGNALFPNGLLSAGSVYDEVTEKKAVKRVGVLTDLGNLNWGKSSGANYYYSNNFFFADYKQGVTNIATCSHYVTKPWSGDNGFVLEYSGNRRPCTALWGNAEGMCRLNILDDSIADVDSLKAFLTENNVVVYYALTEPIIVDLPEPINLNYNVCDFGTEEAIASVPSTPLKADIVYQFNAVDRIRENSRHTDEANELLSKKADKSEVTQVANKQLQLSVKDNGNIVLSNANGESKEFMPATPSGDPMHWAYVSAGAEYNATGEDITRIGVYGDEIIWKNGCWWLNELGDISSEEMKYVYLYRYTAPTSRQLQGYFQFCRNEMVRTPLIDVPARASATDCSQFAYSTQFHTIALTQKKDSVLISNMSSFMAYSQVVKKIINGLDLTYLKADNSINQAFYFANSLVEVRLYNLQVSASFEHSKNLSTASILCMIVNEIAEKTITITLHADAYARAMADTSITTALTNHPNVTLASA